MLTIGQVAAYVGLTPRAIRHYHAVGLLPEPPRTASGYRSYGGAEVVALARIKTLTAAGVPLARVAELIHAGPSEIREAVAEIDKDLRTRIRELQETRKSLARIADSETPFLTDDIAALLQRLRDLGISERTLAHERDGWILCLALYPEAKDEWLARQSAMLDDPDYADLYLLTDQAYGWESDDPRLEQLAQRTVEYTVAHYPPRDAHDWWQQDSVAYAVVNTYNDAGSDAWRALLARIAELLQAHGQGSPEAPAHPG